MKTKRNVFDVKLDPEEQEILDSVERDEWKTVDNFEEEAAFARKAAANFLLHDHPEQCQQRLIKTLLYLN